MSDFITKIITKYYPDQKVVSIQNLSGGCINNAIHVKTETKDFFIKSNKTSLIEMFQSEAKGLKLLHTLSPISTPIVIDVGIIDDISFLVTSWIQKGSPNSKFWKDFGTNLARQHKETSELFGLDHDNFIGSLPQSNNQHSSWYDFFIEERLTPQLKLATSKSFVDRNLLKQFDILMGQLDQLIPNEKPALLHGDLWSGNYMINSNGEASIFDPAVHYGHRETELAFTMLFGGFSPQFYEYYREEYPLESGFEERVDIHNLYPLLVHVNLFGTSYLSGIQQTLKRFT
ncbi:fructosamine kinase family protein [Ekhidna sp.]|uniref:fructosamine kinase family protein n=1 Tax=Ekhidna sp. TaxID=2608089 RepID=UPI003B50B84E